MFNRGEAIHYQNIAKTERQAVHNFKVACDKCCMDPSCMWTDCGKCRIASIHREKLADLRKKKEVIA